MAYFNTYFKSKRKGCNSLLEGFESVSSSLLEKFQGKEKEGLLFYQYAIYIYGSFFSNHIWTQLMKDTFQMRKHFQTKMKLKKHLMHSQVRIVLICLKLFRVQGFTETMKLNMFWFHFAVLVTRT